MWKRLTVNVKTNIPSCDSKCETFFYIYMQTVIIISKCEDWHIRCFFSMLQWSISFAQVTYVRNKNSNIQGRSLNAIKRIFHSIGTAHKGNNFSFEILDVWFREIFFVGNFSKIFTKNWCCLCFPVTSWVHNIFFSFSLWKTPIPHWKNEL